MTRLRLFAVAAVAGAVFAGCGGGDDNQGLSYSEFGDKADEICAKSNAEIKPLSEQLTGKAKNDGPVIEEIVAKQEPAVDEFRELDPPEELQANFDRFVELSDEQVAAASAASEAANSGDQAAYEAALKELQPLDGQSDIEASKLGAAECVGDA